MTDYSLRLPEQPIVQKIIQTLVSLVVYLIFKALITTHENSSNNAIIGRPFHTWLLPGASHEHARP